VQSPSDQEAPGCNWFVDCDSSGCSPPRNETLNDVFTKPGEQTPNFAQAEQTAFPIPNVDNRSPSFKFGHQVQDYYRRSDSWSSVNNVLGSSSAASSHSSPAIIPAKAGSSQRMMVADGFDNGRPKSLGETLSRESSEILDGANVDVPPVWCLDVQDNIVVLGTGSGRLELWDAFTGTLKVHLERI